jgi:hypothetical protein
VALEPTTEHRCGATPELLPIAVPHQLNYCLTPDHGWCPWLARAKRERELGSVAAEPARAPSIIQRVREVAAKLSRRDHTQAAAGVD